MDKIDISKIDRKLGIDTHDLLRDGRSIDLDAIKVSAVLKVIVDKLNQMTNELEIVKNLVFKNELLMIRSKRKSKRLAKGGVI